MKNERAITETLSVPVMPGADVIVAGGGIAGVAAAVAARRRGASVTLLEKGALLGGLATEGLINWYEPICDGQGTQLMTGLCEELLRLSVLFGDDTIPEIWKDASKPVDKALVSPEKLHPTGGRYGTHFSPTAFQLALDELLTREGVNIRLDILAARPMMERGECLGVSCESKSGRQFFPAKVIVDATGDADIFFRAGASCAEGENYFTFIAHYSDLKEKKKALEHRRWMALGADLHGVGQPEGEALAKCITNEQITGFLLRGRRELLKALMARPRGEIEITALPRMPQARKTRRIIGAYTLSESDLKKRSERSIGLACDFERPGDWYEIPWDCLYTPGISNMLAAGRMISSDGWGWDVARVIPVCALSGQAAGTAASRMAREGVAASELDISKLQAALSEQGVRLHHDR